MPKERVVAEARQWFAALRSMFPEIVRAGYFGSYARGDYVPGSDFDVFLEVSSSKTTRRRDRSDPYAPDSFPVSMNLFVYTTDELNHLRSLPDLFISTIDNESVAL